MQLLIAGLVLWWGAHVFKRLLPAQRVALAGKLGQGPAKGVVAATLLIAVVLMVLGYRQMDFIAVYQPIRCIGHLAVLLMYIAVFLTGVGAVGGRLFSNLRHPMLTGGILWAFAHLLVNGDLASILLFGGIGLWAGAQMLLINRSEGAWERPAAGSVRKDVKLAVISLVIYGVIVGVHFALGHNPFLGTYS